MAFLLLVGDLFLPIPATAVMAGLGWLYGPWLGRFINRFAPGSLRMRCVDLRSEAVDALLSENEQKVFHDYGGWILALSRWLPLYRKAPAWPAQSARSVALALLAGSAPMALLGWHLGGGNPPLLISALAPPILWWLIGKSDPYLWNGKKVVPLTGRPSTQGLIKNRGR